MNETQERPEVTKLPIKNVPPVKLPANPDIPDIVEVSWGETINTGRYENVRIDLKAKIHPGQNWRNVLEVLKLRIKNYKERLTDGESPES